MVLTRSRAGLERAAPAGSLVDLVYENEAGRVTRRRVEIVRWSHAGNGFTYLRAYCFLREEERTFRADRIVEWHVVEAGVPVREACERDSPAFPRPVVTFVPFEMPRPSPGPAPWMDRAAQPVRPTTAAMPSPPRAAAAKRKRGRGFLAVVGAVLAIWLLRGVFAADEPSPPRYVPAPVPPKPVVVPAPKPAPRPAPRPADVPAVVSAVQVGRSLAFREATGIVDSRLVALYESADTGGDGALDWSELAAFQAWLDRRYAYRSNESALRPDEFLAQGGGDCEDWSLFTCGLLRYWGWDPYVGSFAGSEHGVGHAVCLVRVAERPPRYRAWSVDGDGYLGGQPVKAGWYVPVDYGTVGDLTNAVGDGWQLRVIWTPERIYGEEM